MREFYVVLGDGRGPRGFLESLIIKRIHKTMPGARNEAKGRCRRKGQRLFVMKAVGYVHIPRPRVAWRKTKGWGGF